MTQNQRILSFDIGIKNMALCMFSINEFNNSSNNTNQKLPFSITEWKVLNLMDEISQNNSCNQILSKKPAKKSKKSIPMLDNSNNHILEICQKQAKYMKTSDSMNSIQFFCEKCAKKQSEFLLPKKIYQSTSLKKMKIEDLEKLLQEFSIDLRDSKTGDSKKTKKSFIDVLIPYFQNRCLQPIIETKKVGAGDTDLITIGRNMVRLLDQVPNIDGVSMVLIENQISTIATRMKSVQGMLAQYFIIRNPNAKIEFISSSNKLRGLVFEEKQEKSTENQQTQQKQHYKKHKTDGVQITKEILEKNSFLESWIPILSASKKKDDLADSFLQGIWYLRKNERIKMDEFSISG